MEILEKDIEDLIFQSLKDSPQTLASRGLVTGLMVTTSPNNVYWHRQVDLNPYGRADIIGYARVGSWIHVDIIELKNRPIECVDFEQIFRYKTAVLEIIGNSFKNYWFPQVNCYLIGPSISSGHFIANATTCKFFKFDFRIDGFHFTKQSGWGRGERDLSFTKTRSGDMFITRSVNAEYEEPDEEPLITEAEPELYEEIDNEAETE